MDHIISADGIKPLGSKVRAMKDAPEPTNGTELKSFLGMVTFYSRFLSNLTTVAAPLYELLKKTNVGIGQASVFSRFEK